MPPFHAKLWPLVEKFAAPRKECHCSKKLAAVPLHTRYIHQPIIRTYRSHRIGPNYQAVHIIGLMSEFTSKATLVDNTWSVEQVIGFCFFNSSEIKAGVTAHLRQCCAAIIHTSQYINGLANLFGCCAIANIRNVGTIWLSRWWVHTCMFSTSSFTSAQNATSQPTLR